MGKADLHCHSKFSDVPSTFVLKAYDSPESFTEPEYLYKQAKSRGMDYVTITDHDDIRGCLELQISHPEDTFISCEVTAYFPDDNCKVHILVYDITTSQYDKMMEIRFDLFALRDYIIEQNIAYSVAHATYDQDGKLTFNHIEKLVLMFDVFEVINGAASFQNNALLHRYLRSLDAQEFKLLQSKHNIKPISSDPWIKGFTGGSDDHCGILIGSAYTYNLSTTKESFIDSLRNKSSLAHGIHGNFEIYATGVVKHIHDYKTQRDKKYHKTKMNDFLEMFFIGEQGNWARRFKKSQSLRYLKRKNSRTHNALHNLLQEINQQKGTDIAQKIPLAYEKVTELHDEMFRSVVKALVKNLPSGNIFKTFEHLSTLFPTMVLASPFIGSMRHQVLKSDLKKNLIASCKGSYTQKALWFTDTIDDLNGVSVSLRQMAKQSQLLNYQLHLVTCVDEENIHTPLPAGTINMPPIFQDKFPGYEQQKIGFPSLLSMMRRIIQEQPDQIIISTPGPLGLGALLCAKLMDVPIKAIYHTDFSAQALRITNEPSLAKLIDKLSNSFYQFADEVHVPSQAYLNKLEKTGIELKRLKIFPRALDLNQYKPSKLTQSHVNLRHCSQLKGEFTLLFAGRISEDKNLKLLVEIFELANQQTPGRYNMVVAGDGPYLENLKEQLSSQDNVYFTGRLDAQDLVSWYQLSDLFVFPSHTDTFGMVILEAQACGTPCLVTSSGGPKEIIKNNVSGKVIGTDECEDWLAAIESYFYMKNAQPEQYQVIIEACTNNVLENNSWQRIFDSVIGAECRMPSNQHTPLQPIAA